MENVVRHKQGDKVKCVNADRLGLQKDAEYIVDCVYGVYKDKQFVYIQGINQLNPFRSDRFVKI